MSLSQTGCGNYPGAGRQTLEDLTHLEVLTVSSSIQQVIITAHAVLGSGEAETNKHDLSITIQELRGMRKQRFPVHLGSYSGSSLQMAALAVLKARESYLCIWCSPALSAVREAEAVRL